MSKRLLLAMILVSSIANAADAPSARIVVQNAPLAGAVYYDAQAIWSQMKVGDRLNLVREASNAHDTRAIKLQWQGHMLGYVPRRDNTDLARQMDHGARVEARITDLHRAANGRHRISYEISIPLK